jgi:hypothetical protein
MDRRFINSTHSGKGRDGPTVFPARNFLACRKLFPATIADHFIY